MKTLYRFTAVPLIAALALVGCNNDNDDAKKGSISVLQPQQQQEITFNENNMMEYLRTFEDIATNNGGNRAVGSAGGQASAKYIAEQANRSGFSYTVTAFKNSENQTGQNVVVEIPGKSNDSIVLIGAHYDSVKESPGINDNASGVSVLLELMNQLSQKKIRPNYTIRLAFWDSEEVDLDGAKAYANKLNESQLKQIKAYINVDMIGAKDPIAMIPNADKAVMLKELEEKLRKEELQSGSSDEVFIQSQLDVVRQMPTHQNDLVLDGSLSEFFQTQKLKVEKTTTVNLRTDIAAFAGKVPVTGFVFRSNTSGKDEFIPCYHKACDTRALIEPKSLGISGKAVVHLLKKLQAI